MAEHVIPILPCGDIAQSADFYAALGFDITDRQERPYGYLAVERGDIELHFARMDDHDPEASYHGCYVVTDDVEALYTSFHDGLWQHYGHIPLRGLPRISQPKDMPYGVRQFLLADPAGNDIRIGQYLETAPADNPYRPPEDASKLQRALHTANLLADSKQDFDAAAKLLDRALPKAEGESAVTMFRALQLRVDLAVRSGDHDTAHATLARVDALEVPESAYEELAVEWERLTDLREALRQRES